MEISIVESAMDLYDQWSQMTKEDKDRDFFIAHLSRLGTRFYVVQQELLFAIKRAEEMGMTNQEIRQITGHTREDLE